MLAVVRLPGGSMPCPAPAPARHAAPGAGGGGALGNTPAPAHPPLPAAPPFLQICIYNRLSFNRNFARFMSAPNLLTELAPAPRSHQHCY